MMMVGMFACLLASCASTSDSRQAMFVQNIDNAPELAAIDKSIDKLSSDYDDIERQYDQLQKDVLGKTNFDVDDDANAQAVNIYINDNNVIMIDNKPMSRNEFDAYLSRVLPRLCQPTPTIIVHKRASYDQALSVLEMVYAHGCMDVDLK